VTIEESSYQTVAGTIFRAKTIMKDASGNEYRCKIKIVEG
jgi:hypothetical protein